MAGLLAILVVACEPPAPVPRATWVGERVEEYRKTLPALDELPEYLCPGPPDDALLVRMMQTFIVHTFRRASPHSSGTIEMEISGDYFSTVLPMGVDTMAPRSPYDLYLYLGHWMEIQESPMELQGEHGYGYGDSWPEDPNYFQITMVHTLTGEADHAEWDYIGWPDFWDDPYYGENGFYPVADCIALTRPDRLSGTFWFDASRTPDHMEKVDTPVWIVWDGGDAYSSTYDLVEYNFVSTSSVSGPRRTNWISIGSYHDDLTLAEVWPHLASDTGE